MVDVAEQNLEKLLIAIADRLGARPSTPQLVEQLIDETSELEDAARAVMGVRSKQAGLSGPADEDRWQILHGALADGASAKAKADRVSLTDKKLKAGLQALREEEDRQWVVFVPLISPGDRVDQLTFNFESMLVSACAVPPVNRKSPVLDEIGRHFGVLRPELGDAGIETMSLALRVSGSSRRASSRALVRFADVRDAARIAKLLVEQIPNFVEPTAAADSIRWLTLTLCPADGSSPIRQSEQVGDAAIGIDPIWPASMHC